MPGTADVILFAIQSAIRLGQQARQAYVDSTRNRALVLPLPTFDPTTDGASALSYYQDLPPEKIPVPIRDIVAKGKTTGLGEDDLALLLTYYNEFLILCPKPWKTVRPSPEGGFLTRDSVASAVQIRQWDREAKWQESHQWPAGAAPGPSPLQRVAGTIVEIGIDYFAHVPGALNDNTRQGKAVRALLESLETVDVTKPLGDLPVRLFLATMEGVSEAAQLVTSSEETQKLISVTSSSLAKDVAKRIQDMRNQAGGSNADKEDGLVQWADLVFRSVLSSGGRLIASDPKTYLGIDKTGDAALVTKVGESVIDFVTKLPNGDLHQVFGKEGLDVVVKAALQAVGEHPEIVVRKGSDGKILSASADGLKKLLSDIASDLGGMPQLVGSPALLTQIVQSILEKTGKNVSVLWPQYASDSGKNLLVVAAQTTLGIISKAPPNGAAWKLSFSDADLLKVADVVLDAFVQNPGWLIDAAGKANENYRVVLEAAIDVLRKHGDSRLSTQTAADILKAVLSAVALRQEFLSSLQDGQKLIGAALDAIMAALFPSGGLDPKAAAVLLRGEVVTAIVDESLKALSRANLSQEFQQKDPDKLRSLLTSHIEQIISGKSWSLKDFVDGLAATIPPAPVANQ
ncbi:MAG: hypothetical protein ABSC19_10205 [Syntrophorhabdales bacterium]|jgi:hypothetical protein